MLSVEICLLRHIITVMARSMHYNFSIQWGISRNYKDYLKDDSFTILLYLLFPWFIRFFICCSLYAGTNPLHPKFEAVMGLIVWRNLKIHNNLDCLGLQGMQTYLSNSVLFVKSHHRIYSAYNKKESRMLLWQYAGKRRNVVISYSFSHSSI